MPDVSGMLLVEIRGAGGAGTRRGLTMLDRTEAQKEVVAQIAGGPNGAAIVRRQMTSCKQMGGLQGTGSPRRGTMMPRQARRADPRGELFGGSIQR